MGVRSSFSLSFPADKEVSPQCPWLRVSHDHNHVDNGVVASVIVPPPAVNSEAGPLPLRSTLYVTVTVLAQTKRPVQDVCEIEICCCLSFPGFTMLVTHRYQRNSSHHLS